VEGGHASLLPERSVHGKLCFVEPQGRRAMIVWYAKGVQVDSLAVGTYSFLTTEDKAAVPLRAVRPLFLRSSFQDDDTFRDALGLTKQVDAALRDVETRGFDAPLVFVDAIECPDAYQMSGRYRRESGQVTVEVRLFKGEAKPQPFQITGNEKNIPDLAKQLAAEALKRSDQAV
jgi:hypothetical protein